MNSLSYKGKNFATSSEIENDGDLDDEEKKEAQAQFNELNSTTINKEENKRNLGLAKEILHKGSGLGTVKAKEMLLPEINARTVAEMQMGGESDTEDGKALIEKAQTDARDQSQKDEEATETYDEETLKENGSVPEIQDKATKTHKDGAVEKRKAETVKKITSNPRVENELAEAGVSLDKDEVDETDLKKAEQNMSDNNGGENPLNSDKSPAETVEYANKLGTWDKLSIGLTAVSFLMFAISGGEVPPVDLTGIGGTKDRIKALTQVRQDYDNFINKAKEASATEQEKKAFMERNPGATEEDWLNYQKAPGQFSYNTSEKSAQDAADQLTQESLLRLQNELGIERDEAQTLNQLKLMDNEGRWTIRGKQLDGKQQEAMAKLLATLDTEKQAKTISAIARDTGMKPEEVLKLQITGQTMAQRLNNDIQGYLNLAPEIVKALF